jgi:hypothetical protein
MKVNKERITIFVFADLDDSEKLPLSLFGK